MMSEATKEKIRIEWHYLETPAPERVIGEADNKYCKYGYCDRELLESYERAFELWFELKERIAEQSGLRSD